MNEIRQQLWTIGLVERWMTLASLWLSNIVKSKIDDSMEFTLIGYVIKSTWFPWTYPNLPPVEDHPVISWSDHQNSQPFLIILITSNSILISTFRICQSRNSMISSHFPISQCDRSSSIVSPAISYLKSQTFLKTKNVCQNA